jgi:hypothetical protein
MARKGRPKKRKTSPKVRYKVGDTVLVNIFGVIKEGIIEEIDNLEGTRLYNITSEKTKYPYVGVDGNGNFWNIDSKLTKIKKGSNGKK